MSDDRRPGPPPPPAGTPRPPDALALHAKADTAVSLAELAAAAGLSRFHLLRLFRRHTGETPAQFHLGLRIDLARRLLRTTSASVSEIAVRCGFADSSHFARTFRRRTGASPSAYRATTE